MGIKTHVLVVLPNSLAMQRRHARVLRVTFRGHGAQPFAAKAGDARAFLAALAKDFGGLHLDRVILAAEPPRPSSALKGELAALMREEAANPGFRKEAGQMQSDLHDAPPRRRTTHSCPMNATRS